MAAIQINTHIDIDIDDIYHELDSREKEELLALLIEDSIFFNFYKRNQNKLLDNDLINMLKDFLIADTSQYNPLDIEWSDACEKLMYNRLRLTNEQEDIIKSIASKL